MTLRMRGRGAPASAGASGHDRHRRGAAERSLRKIVDGGALLTLRANRVQVSLTKQPAALKAKPSVLVLGSPS